MKVSLPPFRVDLSLTVETKLSPALRRKILPAARASLRGLPVSVLRKKLRPGRTYALHVSAIGPGAMKRLNARYRKKSRPTDVLSFSRLEGEQLPFAVPEAGDVILCPEVARRQAAELGIPAGEELQRLTVHGVLHLFGYDHETNQRDARRMFRLQDEILADLGIERGNQYILPPSSRAMRRPGKYRAAIRISADFDAPLDRAFRKR